MQQNNWFYRLPPAGTPSKIGRVLLLLLRERRGTACGGGVFNYFCLRSSFGQTRRSAPTVYFFYSLGRNEQIAVGQFINYCNNKRGNYFAK